MNSVQLIETGDGSHSLLDVAMNETYHSRHGALRESEHVFIRHGLHAWIDQHPTAAVVRILEVGFGTGLNAILTGREARAQNGFIIPLHQRSNRIRWMKRLLIASTTWRCSTILPWLPTSPPCIGFRGKQTSRCWIILCCTRPKARCRIFRLGQMPTI